MWYGRFREVIGYALWMCFTSPLGTCSLNLALNKPAWVSMVSIYKASNAVDGKISIGLDEGVCVHSTNDDKSPWLIVDLLGFYHVHNITIVNRQDCCQNRLHDFNLEVFKTNPTRCASAQASLCKFYSGAFGLKKGNVKCDTPVLGRYVRIWKPYVNDINDALNFCEIEVYGVQQECGPVSIPMVQGKRLVSTSVRSLLTSSRMACVVECDMFGSCVGVNYDTVSGVCELLTRPESSDTVSDLQDWLYYGHDLC